MSDPIEVVAHQDALQARANQVREHLKTIQSNVEDGFFDLCELLLEAQAGNYHNVYGFQKFGDWIDAASGLDLCARSAYYLIRMAKTWKQFGFTRAQIKAVKITSLKEIFSLNPEEHEALIRELIEEAPGMSVEQVKERVRAAKGQSEVLFMTLRLEKSIKPVIDKAFELAKQNYGSEMLGDGKEAKDITDSHCMELICLSYNQDPNNSPEGQAIAEQPEETTE